MSFFPVECAILWLADFFQNLIVSRASVNGDRQKGPPLPQSFSTKVAIESGLYIGTWEQVWQVSGSRWRSEPGPEQVRGRTWFGPGSDLPDGPPERSWEVSGAKPCQTPKSPEIAKISKISKISRFREISRFSRFCEILRFLEILGLALQMPIRAHVWARVHIGVWNDITPAYVHHMFEHVSTHWHNICLSTYAHVASI